MAAVTSSSAMAWTLRACYQQRLTPLMRVALCSPPKHSCTSPFLSSSLIQSRTFAGHNKWSQIKHKKAIKDVRRAKLLSKASRAIIMASRSCAGDVTDLRLQSAIGFAQSVQLPKERIQEAIASYQKNDLKELESHRYDAMLPLVSGIKVACVITAVTDNHKRTAGQVRAAINKVGGDMLPSRKLDFMFQQRGVIVVERAKDSQHLQQDATAAVSKPSSLDQTNSIDDEIDSVLWECAIEHGATNVEYDPSSSTTLLTCEPSDLWNLVTALRNPETSLQQYIHVSEFDIRPVLVDPDTVMVDVTTSSEAQEKLLFFLDLMEDNDDVTNVYHNAILEHDEEEDEDVRAEADQR